MYRPDATPDPVPVTAGRRPRALPTPPSLPTPPFLPSPRPRPAASVPAAAAAAAIPSPRGAGLPPRPWEEPIWEGWWDSYGPAPTTGPQYAAARQAIAEPPVESDGRPATPGLRRRIPQAHLVEQLCQADGNSAVAAPVRSAEAAREAAEALSRYQANRATARSIARQGEGRP